ncbi:polymerase/histidinol phosphatase-like protein [Lineolata rhizophorae]|uniref:Histidinol-phosphatase n=1 Tax=Lineolata rhizophorae TaxID=578093 RepID=A0A6A6NYW4_9PEZI|nr:polymerase/histidinol phosphatase-like protein [Lineolata rhizophorae]
MPFSHHSHSGQFCMHAKGSLEEMVLAAIDRKMTVFALTEHMPRDDEDLYPEEKQAHASLASLTATYDAFYAEATRLRAAYAAQITLLIGFEGEWIRSPRSHALTTALLRNPRYALDLFVGSVHHVNGHPIDLDRATYARARASAGSGGAGTDADLAAAYLDAQRDMLRALRPPVVGHFDLVRLFSDAPDAPWRGRAAAVWARVRRNLELARAYGSVLEVNQAALRKGLREPYPRAEICSEFLAMGGRFTLSDDSHSTDQVGMNYPRVLAFIKKVGIKEVYFFERVDSKDSPPKMSSLSVEELEKHPSWSTYDSSEAEP